jgi:hypothetical protein
VAGQQARDAGEEVGVDLLLPASAVLLRGAEVLEGAEARDGVERAEGLARDAPSVVQVDLEAVPAAGCCLR